MNYKMKICWKWTGNDESKALWLQSCASDFESFEIYCDAEDALSLSAAGVDSNNALDHAGDDAQAMLLALLASGEIQAAVWIDGRDSVKNWTLQAMGLCRSRGIALAVEPAGAAAMLAALKHVLDEQNQTTSSNHDEIDDVLESESSDFPMVSSQRVMSKAAAFKMQVLKVKQVRRVGVFAKKRRNL